MAGKLKLTSPEFENMKYIQKKYTCDGKNISPPLNITDPPSETKSFMLIIDDPDAINMTWDHWIIFNIDKDTRKINEGEIPKGAVQGLNDFEQQDYSGPCPPNKTHRYFFKLYALDTIIHTDADIKKDELIELIKDNIIDHCELVGLYNRSEENS